MKKSILFSILIILGITFIINAQITIDTAAKLDFNNNIKGIIADINSQEGLPYATIYIMHKHSGAISNEKGHYLISNKGLDKTDTVRFQYIGYKTKKITIGELDTTDIIYLKEEIFNLSETIIFGNKLDVKSIVKKVLQYKDSNYRKTTARRQAFIRERYMSEFDELILNYKRSSFDELDQDLLQFIEEKIPKNSTSYTDFLGDLYFSENEDDSITFKIGPVRTVSLKEKDIAELEQIESIFENILADTKEKEYWKIKSGIFGQKIDVDEDEENDESNNDTIEKKEWTTKNFKRRIKYRFRYASLEDKDQWEFLHSTGKYKYNLVGGTRVNGEDVYIIDFKPKSGGAFVGRMYISMTTYALIRADYEYAPEKTGKDFHLLGIGYTENEFTGSIYFEKSGDNYLLKYFSKKTGTYITMDRNLALLKKRERFLFDKTLNEIKVGIELAVDSEESFEILILENEHMSHDRFLDYTEDKKMEIIYVDQFDDQLWKGFSIIEPTAKMREYKKQKTYTAE